MKLLFKHIPLVLLLVCLMPVVNTAFAQSKLRVKGIVTTADGSLLPGVSVTVKDSKQGTVTDSNGVYSINVEKGRILLFNHVGYTPFAKGITEAGTLNVTLSDAVVSMDEVVTIGYGTQKRTVVTGSVSKLENKNLDEIPTSRLDNALIGKIAGVTIQNVTSEAGAEPVVRVRGFNSINANSAPLVVVDGHPIADGLSFVNPADVASVEVLKDAASAAIYGSRAANGVILITTKSGLPNKPKYSVKAYYGVSNPYELNPIMTFSEYTNKLYKEAALRINDTTVAANRKNLILETEKAAYIIENQITGEATDWQKQGLQHANIFDVQLGLSGGTKDLKYYISGNMQQEEGIMKFNNTQRMSMKGKFEGALSKKLKFTINVNPSYIKTERPTVNYTDYFRMYSFVPAYHTQYTAAFVHQNPQWAGILPGDYAQARHFNGLPYSGLLPDGSLWTNAGPVDPWSTQNNTPLSIAARSERTINTYRVLGGIDLSYEIIPKLIFKTSLGGYYNYQEDNTFTRSNAKQDGAVNSAEVYSTHTQDLLWENTLNYTKGIGNHNFAFLAGYTVQQTWQKNVNMVGYNFPTETFETISQAGQIDQSLTKTLKYKEGLLSYLGRINYDYRNKYLLSLSFRTDGSSKFAPAHKWGSFPSVSAGWVVSKESFLSNVKDISNLKLRLSYGATGNNRVPNFSYENLLYLANYSLGSGNGIVNLGLAPNGDVLANPFITWERTFEFNGGLDMAFFNNRLTATIDYYIANTDRLLYNQSTMAFSGSNLFVNNSGKVQNKGIEIDLGGTPIKGKNASWTVSVNLAANKNKLLELGGEPYLYNYGERNEIYAAILNSPSIQYFGYKTDGVWTSDAQIAAAQAAGLKTNIAKYFQTGGLKFVDINGDNVIDIKDRVPLGTPFPDFNWGFNNTVNFKNLDLSILIQGSQGGKVVNGDLYYNETKRFNKNVNTENRWLSAMNPGDGKTPYFTNGADWMLTDYVLESASYTSLRNIILGYKLSDTKQLKRIAVNALRIYASANNLLYFKGSGYRGINPEARSTSGQYSSPLINGYQRGAFPLMKTFTLGLDINF